MPPGDTDSTLVEEEVKSDREDNLRSGDNVGNLIVPVDRRGNDHSNQGAERGDQVSDVSEIPDSEAAAHWDHDPDSVRDVAEFDQVDGEINENSNDQSNPNRAPVGSSSGLLCVQAATEGGIVDETINPPVRQIANPVRRHPNAGVYGDPIPDTEGAELNEIPGPPLPGSNPSGRSVAEQSDLVALGERVCGQPVQSELSLPADPVEVTEQAHHPAGCPQLTGWREKDGLMLPKFFTAVPHLRVDCETVQAGLSVARETCTGWQIQWSTPCTVCGKRFRPVAGFVPIRTVKFFTEQPNAEEYQNTIAGIIRARFESGSVSGRHPRCND